MGTHLETLFCKSQAHVSLPNPVSLLLSPCFCSRMCLWALFGCRYMMHEGMHVCGPCLPRPYCKLQNLQTSRKRQAFIFQYLPLFLTNAMANQGLGLRALPCNLSMRFLHVRLNSLSSVVPCNTWVCTSAGKVRRI